MYPEDEYIQLSSLQHYGFCPRQCALIHVEQQWSENRFTAEGRAQHERVDREERECRGDVVTEYALPLCSRELGLVGKADVVEFHKGLAYPVEHKRGKPKPDECDMVQVCAQALCLEEMLGQSVPEGAIFYGKPRRRQTVIFNEELRNKTIDTCRKVHELIMRKIIPKANYDTKKCSTCSLFEICMPQYKMNVRDYFDKNLV